MSETGAAPVTACINSSRTTSPGTRVTSKLAEAIESHRKMRALLEANPGPAGRRDSVVEHLAVTRELVTGEHRVLDGALEEGRLCREDLSVVAELALLGIVGELLEEMTGYSLRRDQFRKLRRDRYQLTHVLTDLVTRNPAAALAACWHQMTYQQMRSQSPANVDILFTRHGASTEILAMTYGLPGLLAHRRGLPVWAWEAYSLGDPDRDLLAEIGTPSLLHRIDHLDPSWLGDDAAMWMPALDSLGWFEHLPHTARSTIYALIGEWDATLGELKNAAAHL